MLVIYAEKSSLAKNIANALKAGKRIADKQEPTIGHWEFTFKGKPAVICHGVGHLIEPISAKDYDEKFKKWDLEKYPCIPDDLKLQVKKKTKRCYDVVAGFISKADWIINATDPDREGELIFAFLYQSLNCSLSWSRVLIEDTTEKTIRKAFDNPKDSSEMISLQNAGRARSYADWILGINLTVAMTKKFGSSEGILSVGRVQTPTLALVVNREKEINSHKKTPYWKLTANFNLNNKIFSADYFNGVFKDKAAAYRILSACNGKPGTIMEIETKSENKAVPLLYNATQLRIAANKTFGWGLKHTDKIMQTLYEKHLMTYPRSSSEHLPVSMKEDLTAALKGLFALSEYSKYKLDSDQWEPFTKRHFDDSKVGSHTAIIPTAEVPSSLSELTEDETKLYDLLAKSIIRIIYPKATLENTIAILDVQGNKFKAAGTVVSDPGWLQVDSMPEKLKTLPDIRKGETYTGKYSLKEEMTKPPKRYTQATLIEAMELAGKRMEDEEARTLMKLNKMGLGTEATRTAIVQQLINHEYIKTNGKGLAPTKKGIFLIDTLPIEEIKSAEMTGEWEKKLNDISLDKFSYEEYINAMKEKAASWYKMIVDAQGTSFLSTEEKKFTCPICGRSLKMRSFGLGCTGYQDGCKFTIGKEICGKKITENQMVLLLNNGITNIIKGFRSKAGNKFDAKLKLNRQTGKIEFDFPNKRK